jgi:hypothetical protein
VAENWNSNVSIYPNPSSDIAVINVPNASWVQVLDLNGKLISNNWVAGSQLILNATEYAKGTYLVRVNHMGQYYSKKWMVK